MEFFVSTYPRADSEASLRATQAAIASRGWGNWAVERRAGGEFIGFTGLSVPRRTFPF